MRRRYLVLRAFSAILRILGWVAVVIGIVLFAVGLFTLLRSPADMLSIAGARDMLGGGVGAVVGGLASVLYGEVIEVFIDIEANTRRTAEMVERPAPPPPPH